MVFVNYVHLNTFEKTTKAINVFKKVTSFFKSENLLWENLCKYCTDKAPAMLGTKYGFQVYIKKQNPNTKKRSLYDSLPCASLQNISSSIT